MRIRLVHTQSLLLLAAVLLAVVSMGALNAWNLRNGFAEFLSGKDTERLEQFASFVAENADREGGINGLNSQGLDLRELLKRFARAQGIAPDRAQPAGLGNASAAPLLPRPPPPDRANAFRERVALYDLDGKPLLGPGITRDGAATIERPVRLRGEVIANVRMVKLKHVQDDMEAQFLTSQYASMAVVASALLLIALASARWVAGRWVRPLLEVQAATEHISAGDFDVRLQDARTDEIGDVMRNVNRMASNLQQLEGARRQWIADISHELRTPLTVLRGEIDALMDGIRPMHQQAIASLREEVIRLASLVDDLHLLSMADLNALPCYFEELDAVELVHKVTDRFALRSNQLGLALSLEVVTHGASTQVRWDSKRVGQLLGNLVDNSLRYTDAPGKISVKLLMNHSQAVVTIDDSAPGVADQDRSRLFEPLYRADAARSRHNGGSGLGLAICTAIVHAHHGSIEANVSTLGGIQIRVKLPIKVGDAA